MTSTHECKIAESISLRLHTLRWVSAILVLVGHIEMVSQYKSGISIVSNGYLIAHLSVMTFFVVSGFTIAYVCERTPLLKHYVIDRVTRIHIVLLPAVILTATLDYIGIKIARDLYEAYTPHDYLWIRFFINILGLQGWQGYRVQFGSNAALWSIGYELFYYLTYGLIFYKLIPAIKSRSWRLVSLLVLTIMALLTIAGKYITLYMFIWLLGVASYYVQKCHLSSGRGFVLFALIFCGFSILFMKGGFLQDIIFSFGISFFILAKIKNWKDILGLKLSVFSFSLYATHLPIIFLTYSIFYSAEYNYYYFFLFVAFVSITTSWLFSIVFEKQRGSIRNIIYRRFIGLNG